MTRVDVAVVGASPAGLRAAWAAAEGGADVVLLEAKDAIADPPSPAAVGFDFLWPASVRAPPRAVLRRYAGVRLVSPGGHALDVDAPAAYFDRVALDRHLAAEAEAAGARIVTGARGLVARADRSLSGDGVDVRANVVVFADGAASLARAFLAPVADERALAWGAAFELAAPGADAEARLRITLGSHAPGGRSQLNPVARGRWTHWTFARGSPALARERAERALALDAERLGWPASVPKEARFLGIAPDPVHALPKELVADGVMVAGGAAGQGGLETGLASGEMAGAVAARAALSGRADRAALAAYERAWKRRYLAGYRALRRETDRLARVDDATLDGLFRPWRGRRLALADLVALAGSRPLPRAAAAVRLAARNPRAVIPFFRVALPKAARRAPDSARPSWR